MSWFEITTFSDGLPPCAACGSWLVRELNALTGDTRVRCPPCSAAAQKLNEPLSDHVALLLPGRPAITIDMSGEEAIGAREDLRGACKALREQLAQMEAMADEQLLEWMDQHGSIEAGEWLWYAGVAKSPPKCKSVSGVLAGLLDYLGGDETAIAECLGAGAWKHGEIKAKLDAIEPGLGDSFFAAHWEQFEAPAPKRKKLRVIKANKNYARRAKK